MHTALACFSSILAGMSISLIISDVIADEPYPGWLMLALLALWAVFGVVHAVWYLSAQEE